MTSRPLVRRIREEKNYFSPVYATSLNNLFPREIFEAVSHTELLVSKDDFKDSIRSKAPSLRLQSKEPRTLGRTVLMQAVIFDNYEAVECILSCRAPEKRFGLHRCDSEGLTIYFLVLESGNRTLLELILEHSHVGGGTTENAIDVNEKTFDMDVTGNINQQQYQQMNKTVGAIEFILEKRDTTPIFNRLQMLEVLLEHGVDMPTRIFADLTLVEYVIFYLAFIDQKTRSYDFQENKDSLPDNKESRRGLSNQYEEALQLCINILNILHHRSKHQNEEFNLTCSGGATALHVSCRVNQESLLAYFLEEVLAKPNKIANKMDKGYVRRYLEQVDNNNRSPLLECCRSSYDILPKVSRLDCAEMLIKAGADVNSKVTRRNEQPLSYCLRFWPLTEMRQEVACCLIKHGADILEPNQYGVDPVKYTIMNNAKTVLQKIIQDDLLPKDYRAGKVFYMTLLPYAVFKAADLDPMPTGAALKRSLEPRLETILMLEQYGLSTEGCIYELLFFWRNPAGRYLFKAVIEAGFDLRSPGPIHHSLMAICTVAEDFRYFNLLVRYQADIHTKMELKLCMNQPSHRWLAHDNMQDLIRHHNWPPASWGRCSLCSVRFGSPDMQISSCYDANCNHCFCQDCHYFSPALTARKPVTTKRGRKKKARLWSKEKSFTAYTLALRRANSQFINPLHFLSKTEVGKELFGTEVVTLFDSLLNANLSSKKIVSRMARKHFEALGITSAEIQLLLNLFKH